MKTNKSYSKRIRVTKNGKLVARKPGQTISTPRNRVPSRWLGIVAILLILVIKADQDL